MADSSSSSSDSDDSDDDFLTLQHDSGGGGAGGGAADREALVRKKLLENFYGKSAVAQAKPTDVGGSDDDDDDDDDDNNMFRKKRSTSNLSRGHADSEDEDDDVIAAANLDSPRFDAVQHTQQHVWHSNVHSLLETEERLALQVRTLDSTMQTLVYENYSRFIDATDAIKSIGVNVQANEQGLHQLTSRLQAMDRISKQIEEDGGDGSGGGLGQLRDQVAEKIRVQRLLTRLDALLKLPQTLHQHIANGKYRTATTSYLSAASILSQHSQGFESLQKIESECTVILQNMKKSLVQKLLRWSGRLMNNNNNEHDEHVDVDGMMAGGDGSSSSLDNDYNNNNNNETPSNSNNMDGGSNNELPKTMREIFECAGTLCILLDEPLEGDTAEAAALGDDDQQQQQQQQLDADDLQSIAVAAASRALDRILDTHMIQVQERRFSGGALDEGNSAGNLNTNLDMMLMKQPSNKSFASGGAQSESQQQLSSAGMAKKGAAFIPIEYLNALLEVAQLYGSSFGSKTIPGYLTDFVSEASSSFLSHVEAILLEESALLATREEQGDDDMMDKNNTSESNMDDTGAGMSSAEAGDLSGGYYEEISGALSILVLSIRETASGLAVPEVGMSPDYASSLVDKAVKLTDSMVRLRVDQKFYELRRKIAKDCLKPFAASAATLQVDAKQKSQSQPQQQGSSSSMLLLPEILPVAQSTISDCLQLVDDTIRSILSTGLENKDNAAAAAASPDLPILKDAVRASTRRFAAWLANALEILAGGESSDCKRVVEAPVFSASDHDHDRDGSASGTSRARRDDFGDVPEDQDEHLMELVDAAKKLLLVGADGDNEEEKAVDGVLSVHRDFILAISEMCRLAEGSVSENLEQSIATHLGGKKKSRGMFPHAGDSSVLSKKQDEIGRRFSLAASRVLSLYAVNRGDEAAQCLCSGLADLYSDGQDQPQSPRAVTYEALQIVKTVSLECADIFGCPKRAGPLPKMDDSNSLMGRGLSSNMRKTSLQLDVERIFKDKVPIFPHPSQEMEASGNAVNFVLLKVAFRALLEHVRMNTFSASGYQQLQLDTEFLKHMLPHYIHVDFAALDGNNACSSLSNLLADVMAAVLDRCTERDVVTDNEEELLFESRSALDNFLQNVAARDPEVGDLFIIRED